MTQPANTFSSYDAVGNREDLTNSIYDISPTTTPFLSMATKNKATATFHEWQTDELAAVDAANAVVEGGDAETDNSNPTARLGNYTQISDKVARTTGTQDMVDSAGRGNELTYQKMKRKKELKRDMETILLSDQARGAGSDTVARTLAGVGSWISTNTSFGTGGADPTGDGTDSRTAGTARPITEGLLKGVLSDCFDEGGEPDCIMVGSHNKQAISDFVGNQTRNVDADEKKLVNAIDIYVSDFGTLVIKTNRFMPQDRAYVLDSGMWSVAELRSFKEYDLAKTGDSERCQIITEYTLEARNEKSSGGIFDLATA